MSAAITRGRVAPAWLLEYGSGRFAAFAVHSTLALFDTPPCALVPGAPLHCLGLIRWENRRLPLIDLGLLNDKPVRNSGNPTPAQALVLAWQPPAPATRAELGAVAAPNRVTRIEVRDEQQCDAPDSCGMFRLLAASWFVHESYPVAVIDTARLFSAWLAGTRVAAPIAKAA